MAKGGLGSWRVKCVLSSFENVLHVYICKMHVPRIIHNNIEFDIFMNIYLYIYIFMYVYIYIYIP